MRTTGNPDIGKLAVMIVDRQNDFLARNENLSHIARERAGTKIDTPFLIGSSSMPLAEELLVGARFPLTIRQTPKRGRSLIALTKIPKLTTIEIAPVQVLPVGLIAAINTYNSRCYFISWQCPGG